MTRATDDEFARTSSQIEVAMDLLREAAPVMPALKLVAGWDAAKIDIDEEGGRDAARRPGLAEGLAPPGGAGIAAPARSS